LNGAFPLFAEAAARGFSVELGAGDALLIPRWWWHQSSALSDGQALNWWFERAARLDLNLNLRWKSASEKPVGRAGYDTYLSRY
jgi:hypothetical protein